MSLVDVPIFQLRSPPQTRDVSSDESTLSVVVLPDVPRSSVNAGYKLVFDNIDKQSSQSI